MAVVVGRLTIQVGASTAMLSKGLNSGLKSAKSFAGGVSSTMSGVIKNLANVTIAAQGIKRAMSFLTGIASNISDIGKAARGLGITVESFSSLEFAFGQVSTVSGGQFATAMQKLVNNLQDAQDGTGEAGKALEKLGLTADQLTNLSADQALLRIADGMKNLGTAGERTQVAMDLFGRAGADMAVALSGGSKAITDLQGKSDQLGITLSKDSVDAAEKFIDALDAFKKASGGVAAELLEAVTPVLVDTIEYITKLVAVTKEVVEIFSPLIKLAKDYSGILTVIVIAIGALIVATLALTTAVWLYNAALAVKAALEGPAGWVALGIAAAVAATAVGASAAAVEHFNERIANVDTSGVGRLKNDIDENTVAVENLGDGMQAIPDISKKAAGQAGNAWDRLGRKLGVVKGQINEAAEAQQKLNDIGRIDIGSAKAGTVSGFTQIREAQRNLEGRGGGGFVPAVAKVEDALKVVAKRVDAGTNVLAKVFERNSKPRVVRI